MTTREVLDKWHIDDDDAWRIYRSTNTIPDNFDRMVARRYQVADLLNYRGIPFNSFVLNDETVDIDKAITDIGWEMRGVRATKGRR